MEFIVTALHNVDKLQVFINGTLHITIPRHRFAGLQSWNCHGKHWHIEIKLEAAGRLHLEYDHERLWEDVIGMLEQL